MTLRGRSLFWFTVPEWGSYIMLGSGVEVKGRQQTEKAWQQELEAG